MSARLASDARPATAATLAALALAGCVGEHCDLHSANFNAPQLTPIGGDRLCHSIGLANPAAGITCIELESNDPAMVEARLRQYGELIVQSGWDATEHPHHFQRRVDGGRCVEFLAMSLPTDATGTLSFSIAPTSVACGCDI